MRRRHEALVDTAVPVLVGAVIVVGEVLHGGHSVRLPAVLLTLAAAGTLFARRRSPGWTLAVSGALVAALFQSTGPPAPWRCSHRPSRSTRSH